MLTTETTVPTSSTYCASVRPSARVHSYHDRMRSPCGKGPTTGSCPGCGGANSATCSPGTSVPRIIGQDQAKALIRGAEAELVDFEREVDSTEVMDLVAVSTCSAYDCEYVALARSTGNSLVTEDARIVRDFPDVAVTLATVLSGS